ncbi:hypothetical protein M0804_009654 [Polistes exclamans]|nr:hypothetical protein M0804_009654 [Polistes exclamans]
MRTRVNSRMMVIKGCLKNKVMVCWLCFRYYPGRSMPSIIYEDETSQFGDPMEFSQGHKRASGPRVQARRVYYQAGFPIKRQQL